MDLIEETETLRVRLEPDIGHGPPDWDGQGYVILSPNYGRTKVWHVDHGDPSEIFNLPHAIDRFGLDYDRIERYLRMFHDVVSFDYDSTPGSSVMFFVVTRAQAQHWGCPPETWPDLAGQTCTTWRQFLDGEVYGYVIEEKTRWGRLDSEGDLMWRLDSETFERWDQVDSCWGLYGREYAEAEALDAFRALAGQVDE